MDGLSLGEVVRPLLSSLADLAKVGLAVGIPLALVAFCGWFAFIRWSQHGVDL